MALAGSQAIPLPPALSLAKARGGRVKPAQRKRQDGGRPLRPSLERYPRLRGLAPPGENRLAASFVFVESWVMRARIGTATVDIAAPLGVRHMPDAIVIAEVSLRRRRDRAVGNSSLAQGQGGAADAHPAVPAQCEPGTRETSRRDGPARDHGFLWRSARTVAAPTSTARCTSRRGPHVSGSTVKQAAVASDRFALELDIGDATSCSGFAPHRGRTTAVPSGGRALAQAADRLFRSRRSTRCFPRCGSPR